MGRVCRFFYSWYEYAYVSVSVLSRRSLVYMVLLVLLLWRWCACVVPTLRVCPVLKEYRPFLILEIAAPHFSPLLVSQMDGRGNKVLPCRSKRADGCVLIVGDGNFSFALSLATASANPRCEKPMCVVSPRSTHPTCCVQQYHRDVLRGMRSLHPAPGACGAAAGVDRGAVVVRP